MGYSITFKIGPIGALSALALLNSQRLTTPRWLYSAGDSEFERGLVEENAGRAPIQKRMLRGAGPLHGVGWCIMGRAPG